ncbi:MAG: hypothetical protein ACRD1B_05930 [Thermoanaerobaculia bacterium]
MRRAPVLAALLACALGAACACGRSSQPAGKLSVQPKVIQLGYPQSVPLSVSWDAARALDRQGGRPRVFVHLLDRLERPRKLLRTYDYPLANRWTAGQSQQDTVDLYQSALADPLPPGRYVLTAGLYDSVGGERWPLDSGAPAIGKMEYEVAAVEVAGPDPSMPKFEFAGNWLPAEPLNSRQILTRRCLAGPATLAASGAGSRGSVRLLVSDPPNGPAEVRAASSCETGRTETISAGQKWLDFAIAAGARCEITLEPAPAPPSRPPACLDVLAWRPAAK